EAIDSPITDLEAVLDARGLPTETFWVLEPGESNQSPSLADEALPSEVQNLIASFSSEPLFIKNEVRIIESIRAEASLNP
ncbi:MAG: hypothetical protein ACPG5J_16105, partial [Pseudomonadales bacterium]